MLPVHTNRVHNCRLSMSAWNRWVDHGKQRTWDVALLLVGVYGGTQRRRGQQPTPVPARCKRATDTLSPSMVPLLISRLIARICLRKPRCRTHRNSEAIAVSSASRRSCKSRHQIFQRPAVFGTASTCHRVRLCIS